MKFEKAKVTIDYNELQALIESVEELSDSLSYKDANIGEFLNLLRKIDAICGDKPEFKEIKDLCEERYWLSPKGIIKWTMKQKRN